MKKKPSYSFASYSQDNKIISKEYNSPQESSYKFGSSQEILKNAVILDIETLGLRTESIHEAAMYHLGTNQLDIFIPEVNLIRKIEEESNSATKASSASTMDVDVLKHLRSREPGKFEPLIKQMTYRDIAFADYLMNKNRYDEILKNIQKLKKSNSLKSNTILETKVNSLEDRLNRLVQIDKDASILPKEKEIQKAGVMLGDLSAYSDVELLKTVGFHDAFARDEEFLAKYILEGSKGFEEFAKKSPQEAAYLKYMYDNSVKYDADFFNKMKEAYAEKLKSSGQYVQSIFENTKINVRTGVSQKDLLYNIALLRQDKALFVANLSYESKKFGTQLRASLEDSFKAEEAKYLSEAPDAKPKDVATEVRRRTYSQSVFSVLGQPVSASTGEPFYATGIEYNKTLTQAKLNKDFSAVIGSMVSTAGEISNLDIQDIIRSQQSLSIHLGLLNAEKPLGLSMEAQSRLYMFTNMLQKDASEEALTEILAEFKETHTAGLDTLIHENVALKESMEQAEALREHLLGSEKGKELYKLGKQRKGALYNAVVYSELMKQLTPDIESINLQKRLSGDLKQLSEFGYITQSKNVSKPIYREQVRYLPGSDIVETTKIQTPGYDRDYFQSYREFRNNINQNAFPKKQEEFKVFEQELLNKGFIYQTSAGEYEFQESLLNIKDESPKAVKLRQDLVSFTTEREKTTGDTVKTFRNVAKGLNKQELLQRADRFFYNQEPVHSDLLANTKLETKEKTVSENIRKTLKMAQEHKETADRLIKSKQAYTLQNLEQIKANATPEIVSAKESYFKGEPIGEAKSQRVTPTIPATEENFNKAYFETEYNKAHDTNLSSEEILAREQNIYGKTEKQAIKQAAERGETFGKKNLKFEEDINKIPLYGEKTIEDYKIDFEQYKKTGKVLTSYGVEQKDPLFTHKMSLDEKIERYSQFSFELEESYLHSRTPEGKVRILTEPELKQQLFVDPNVDFSAKPTVTPGFESLDAFEARQNINIGKVSGVEKNQIVNTIVSDNFDNGLEKYYAPLLDSGAAVKFFGMYGAGVAALAVLGMNQEEEKVKSVLSPDFDTWFANQSKFFGGENNYKEKLNDKYFAENEGMSEQGIAPLLRKLMTDFGSPYQGPAGSYAVFEDQKLMAEREKYSRYIFTERYFSPKGDIYNLLRSFVAQKFKEPIRYFPSGGERVSGQEAMSLKGNNLVKLNLKDGYDITVEDADTITIQKKGAPDNALSKFMGSGNYSFRLAGIDAPETAHDDRAAQPYAEQAKATLQQMVDSGQDLSVVFDPSNVTYGRQVATLFAGDTNLNLELLKRGAVAYLPYEGKGEEQMYNEKAFSAAQKYAMESRRGIFSQPFFQVYNDVYKQTQQSVTFNTFANYEKASRDSNLTNMLGVMLSAQKEGKVNEQHKEEISQIVQDIQASQRTYKSKLDFLQTSKLQMTYQQKNFGKPFEDDFTSVDMHLKPARHNEFMSEMQFDLKRLIETKGSKNLTNKLEYSGAMLDNNLSLLESSSRPVSRNNLKRSSNANKANRIKQMEALQHHANRTLKQNPIQHNRI